MKGHAPYKVTVSPTTKPVVPAGWTAIAVGPDLEATPQRRTTRRRGSSRRGTVAPLTVETYPVSWVVFDPARHSVHFIEDAGFPPAGARPIDATYGVFVHTFRSRPAAKWTAVRSSLRARNNGTGSLSAAHHSELAPT